MRRFWIQYLKDFKANFSSFNAYAIFTAYYILSLFSAVYLGDYFLRESDVMNSYFILQPIILTLVIPAITMRSWADEAKSGTLELLLTQPIGYFTLVAAKFAAAFSFFALLAASSLFLFAISDNLSVLDKGVAWSGYAGLLCCGALFCAAGCTISALNRNNILSYIAAIFVLFFITQIEFTTFSTGNAVISLRALNFEDNYKAFLSGSLTWGNVFYFATGTVLFLWLNTAAAEYRKSASAAEKREFSFFGLLLAAIFISGVLGASFILATPFDVTEAQKFTLMPENRTYLAAMDKKINITLFEAKDKREEANSGYAVYAEFAEKIFRLVETASGGAVRVETVLVPSFSPLERKLVYDDKIWFEEDSFGKKNYMAAVFSDNEGNSATIDYFSNLRQNLLETDIMRLIKSFGNEKKKLAIVASAQDLAEMQSFVKTAEEFYDVKYFNTSLIFIPKEFAAAVVINPTQYSTEFLLALEQYVLNGGSLILFSEPELIGKESGKPIISFLSNFGLMPQPAETLHQTMNGQQVQIGAATVVQQPIGRDIRSTAVNGAGRVDFKSGEKYTAEPLLNFAGNIMAAVSTGEYVSDYLASAALAETIQPVSAKPGKTFFIYDSDILKDYLYVSDESKGHRFYQTIPTADNMLFLLRLLDAAANGKTESTLGYRHYAVNTASIGHTILQDIKNRYKTQTKELEDKIHSFKQRKDRFYDTVQIQGFASVKNIGDISGIEQNIDRYEDELYKLRAMVASDYQTIIIGLTGILILAFPLALILATALAISLFRRVRQRKIRRLMRNAETY